MGPTKTGERRAGRPTSLDAQRRHEELLDRTFEMFSDAGYDHTTIDAITTKLKMTKRTIYRRYRDKEDLFRAAVHRATSRHFASMNIFATCEVLDLEITLNNIANARAKIALSNDGLRLRRLINSESARFSQVLEIYEEGAEPAIEYLSDLFVRHPETKIQHSEDAVVAAKAFLSLIATPVRLVVLGKAIDWPEIQDFTRRGIALFLKGVARPALNSSGSEFAEHLRRCEEEIRNLKLALAEAILEISSLRNGSGAGKP